MNIRILPEAERDLELGADFYESQRAGLGRYFNDCLSSDIGVTATSRRSTRTRLWFTPLRVGQISVHHLYDFDGNTVDVYAVLDCRQDPDKIESRLSSR